MLEAKTDHDLLIRHAVKIDTMCAMLSTLGAKFDDFTSRVDTRCEVRQTTCTDKFAAEHDGRMDVNTVRWLIGILIIVILSIAGTVGYNQLELQKQRNDHDLITHQIKTNTDDIKQNQGAIKAVQQIILNKINEG